MHSAFQSSRREEDSEWLSVSDLMAGLMIIFLFVAIVFIRPLAEENRRVREIAHTWQENEVEIYEALYQEFKDDLPIWNAEIEEETLLVRFRSPDVLFERGRDTLRPQFLAILEDFFPRYVTVIEPFRDSIEEIRIEGHTSSDWGSNSSHDQAYFNNMELSQSRTRAVLSAVLTLPAVGSSRAWLQPLVTANGLSSSRLVLNADGVEDAELSRRVEFRLRTTARTEIVRILEEVL